MQVWRRWTGHLRASTDAVEWMNEWMKPYADGARGREVKLQRQLNYKHIKKIKTKVGVKRSIPLVFADSFSLGLE